MKHLIPTTSTIQNSSHLSILKYAIEYLFVKPDGFYAISNRFVLGEGEQTKQDKTEHVIV